jgi:hypothetical protein
VFISCPSAVVRLTSYILIDVIFLQYPSRAFKHKDGSVEEFCVEFIARDGNRQVFPLQLQGSLY